MSAGLENLVYAFAFVAAMLLVISAGLAVDRLRLVALRRRDDADRAVLEAEVEEIRADWADAEVTLEQLQQERDGLRSANDALQKAHQEFRERLESLLEKEERRDATLRKVRLERDALIARVDGNVEDHRLVHEARMELIARSKAMVENFRAVESDIAGWQAAVDALAELGQPIEERDLRYQQLIQDACDDLMRAKKDRKRGRETSPPVRSSYIPPPQKN